VVEIFDLNMERIGHIPDTWDNELTTSLNAAGEFSFSAALSSINIETLDLEPNEAVDRIQHNTFIRWREGQQYLFTGLVAHLEREETESGELLAKATCYGALHYLQRYNVRARTYKNVSVTQIVTDLLSVQDVIRVGELEMEDPITITFAYESVHDALFALRDVLGGDIFVDPDTLELNWVRRMGETGPEIRYRKNMSFIRFLSDSAEFYTRIIPLGAKKGEGEERVTIAEINEGLDYLEADTAEEFGVVEYVWEDERYRDPYTLKKAAERLLQENKRPAVSYETSMLDLSRWRDEWGDHPYREGRPGLGDTVRVYHPGLGVDITERIVKITQKLDEDKRHELGIEIAEKKRTWADIVANLGERSRSSRYATGYHFTANHTLSEDLTATTKKTMRVYVNGSISSISYARLLYTGSETGGGTTGEALSAYITVKVNGTTLVDASATVQRELEIGPLLNKGQWNTVEFSASGPIHVDASLEVKTYYEE
jgi:phage minor structural protein